MERSSGSTQTTDSGAAKFASGAGNADFLGIATVLPLVTDGSDGKNHALRTADALAIMTPWPQFGTLDPVQVARKLRGKLVLDPYAVLNAVAEKGPPMLRGAVLDAVKQWKYKPYRLDGTPQEVETVVTVKFQ